MNYHLDKKTIIKFIKNTYKYYPEYKIKEYLELDEHDKNYQKITSNQQINSLIKISKNKNNTIISRLLNILCKKKNLKSFDKVIKVILSKKLNDDNIYDFLRKIHKTDLFGGKPIICDQHEVRAQEFIHILNRLNVKKNINNYLDIGCGSGVLTEKIGLKLGLSKNNIFGSDLDSFAEQKDWGRNLKKLQFKFIKINPNQKYPFKDNYFSLISSFMVLHHIKDLDFILKELSRITKKNGILIIREHDCLTYVDKMLADIVHIMYEVVYSKNYDKTFKKNYFAKYYDRFQWEYILSKYNFKRIYTTYISLRVTEQHSPDRSFTSIYIKI